MDPNLSPTLLRLCLGALPRPVRELLRHLATCPRCGISSYSEPAVAAVAAPADPAYDRAFAPDRALRVAHLERCRAGRLATVVDDLLAGPPGGWKAAAAQAVDLFSPAGVRTVLARAEAVLDVDPRLALLRARLALSLLDDLELAEVVVEPLRVRVLTLLGVAHGRVGEEAAAREAFRGAGLLLPDCLDSDDDATLLRCQAARLEREGRPSEALALLARAAWISGELGDAPAETSALRSAGLLYLQMGNVERAVQSLTWALFTAETAGGAATAGDLRHQLAWLLLAEDDVAAAREMFGEGAPDPRHFRQVPLLVRLLAHGSPARTDVVRLRRELAAAHGGGDAFQAAVAAILLARHYVRTGDCAQLEPLARYVAAAAEARQLAAPCRVALDRLALALREADVSIPMLIQAARSLRYAADDDEPEPAPDHAH